MAYPGYGAPAGGPPGGYPGGMGGAPGGMGGYPASGGYGAPNMGYGPPGGVGGYPAPGGYGAPNMGYGPPGGVDPLWGYFSAVAGQDGQIDAVELQRCLTSSGIAGSYQQFSLETCRVLISMLDRDYSGTMGFPEFKELWAALNQWKTSFMTFDRDRSGTVEPHELHQAIRSWGYNLSPQALNIIVKRYSENGRIKFDDFVASATRLRLLSDHFRRRDVTQTGNANFTYDDFIQVTMFA